MLVPERFQLLYKLRGDSRMKQFQPAFVCTCLRKNNGYFAEMIIGPARFVKLERPDDFFAPLQHNILTADQSVIQRKRLVFRINDMNQVTGE